jgi:hypothetical protein
LVIVTAQPSSSGALTCGCRAGSDVGTWKLGVVEVGFTTVESKGATPTGGVQAAETGDGVSSIRYVNVELMSPGVNSTVPGLETVCHVSGLYVVAYVYGVFDCGVKVIGRFVAFVVSVFGFTEPLGAPLVVRPSTSTDCESIVMLLAPSVMAAFIVAAGMVTSTDRVVEKVPGAVMLGGAEGDSDSRIGTVVSPGPDRSQV